MPEAENIGDAYVNVQLFYINQSEKMT